jgi:hypothetical protein
MFIIEEFLIEEYLSCMGEYRDMGNPALAASPLVQDFFSPLVQDFPCL